MDIISSTNSSHTYKTSISSTGNLQHVFDTGAGGIQEFKVNGTTQLSISPSAVTVPTLVVSTGLTVAGNSITSGNLLSLNGVTAGQAASGKALILDSNGSITGITSLTSTTLNGKLGVGSGDQSNITTVGTLGSLTVTNVVTAGSLVVGSASLTAAELGFIDGVTAGTAANNKALVLDGTGAVTGIATLTATGAITAGSLSTAGTLTCGAITATGSSHTLTSTGSTFLTLQTSSTGAARIQFIRGSGAYGTNSNTDWLIQNDSEGTLTFSSDSNTITGDSQLKLSPTKVSVLPTTASISTTTGALTVAGGVGIAGRVSAGSLTCGSIASTQPINVTTASGTPASLSLISTTDLNSYPYLELVRGALGDSATDWRVENSGLFTISSRSTGSSFTTQLSIIDSGKVGINILNPTTALDVNGTFRVSGVATLSNATVSSSVSTGALVVTGGVGVGGQLSAGSLSTPGSISAAGSVTCGTIHATGSSHTLTSSGSTFLTLQTSSTGAARIQFIRGSGAYGTNSNTDWLIQNDSEGTLTFSSDSNTITGDSQLKLSPTKVSVLPTTASTSTTTGALTVAGGAGIAGSLYCGKIYANDSSTGVPATISSASGDAGFAIMNNSTSSGDWTQIDLVRAGYQFGTAGVPGNLAQWRIRNHEGLQFRKYNTGGELLTMEIVNGGEIYRGDGGTTFNTRSDRRIKENISNANLDMCYANVKNLRLTRYNFTDEYKTQSGQIADNNILGWIAQEVEEFFPKSVKSTNAFGYEDLKTINIDEIMKTLYGCVQKIIIDKEQLETKNVQLEERIQSLEQMIHSQSSST